MEATADGLVSDSSEEREEAGRVFALIDHERQGVISEAALAQALLSTQLCNESQARMTASDACRDGSPLRAALSDALLPGVRQLRLAAAEGDVPGEASYLNTKAEL